MTTTIEPFDKPVIDELILDLFCAAWSKTCRTGRLPATGTGYYARHPGTADIFGGAQAAGGDGGARPSGGAGMTMAFGNAEHWWDAAEKPLL